MNFVKALIQQSLWQMYNDTGDKAYKELYNQWLENSNEIKVSGLE